MTELTLSERALAHIRKHPGAQSRAVADALSISTTHAANVLTGLERRGLLDSRPAYISGANYRRRFFPADTTGQARAVAARAQSFGGPFGLLVAQLTR